MMALDFEKLLQRLIEHLQGRIRSGEITERSMARVAGVSQPHLHHVLKGKRLLSIGMADQILHRLHVDLWDLLDNDAPRR